MLLVKRVSVRYDYTDTRGTLKDLKYSHTENRTANRFSLHTILFSFDLYSPDHMEEPLAEFSRTRKSETSLTAGVLKHDPNT